MLNEQKVVAEFCKRHNLSGSAEIRLLDTLSELGEVAKEILKSTNYGASAFEQRDEIKSELGDLFFSLLTLANELDVPLDEALTEALAKYERRLKKGGAGSEND
jgi:NTP pyrophosphatase (non-canonical NTP hydrolase)